MNPHNYTPRLQKALAIAGKLAKDCNHSYVGTEHVFVGILQCAAEGGPLADALKAGPIDSRELAQLVENQIRPKVAEPKSAPGAEWIGEATQGLRKLADLLETLAKKP